MSYNIPSAFYDPLGKLEDDVRHTHGIELLSSTEELQHFFSQNAGYKSSGSTTESPKNLLIDDWDKWSKLLKEAFIAKFMPNIFR